MVTALWRVLLLFRLFQQARLDTGHKFCLAFCGQRCQDQYNLQILCHVLYFHSCTTQKLGWTHKPHQTRVMAHIPVQLSKPLLCFFGSVLHMCSSGVSSGFLILTHRTRRYPSPAIFSLGFPYTSQLSRVPLPCSCSSDQKEVFFSVYLPLAISIYLGLTSVRENRKRIERKIIKQCGFPSIYCLHSIGYVTIDMGYSLGA